MSIIRRVAMAHFLKSWSEADRRGYIARMAQESTKEDPDAGMLPDVIPADPEADARGAAIIKAMSPDAIARQVSDGSDLVFEDSPPIKSAERQST